jgi:hypothetical protein
VKHRSYVASEEVFLIVNGYKLRSCGIEGCEIIIDCDRPH